MTCKYDFDKNRVVLAKFLKKSVDKFIIMSIMTDLHLRQMGGMGENMAMNMDTGDIHMISSWSDDDE